MRLNRRISTRVIYDPINQDDGFFTAALIPITVKNSSLISGAKLTRPAGFFNRTS
jgi:hypothetical protein